MSKLKKKHVGKIGYCDNSDLGINKVGGHYVYIREIYGSKCSVNIITSLEKFAGHFDYAKISHVKKGNTYPIPKYDANFTVWSGINKTPIKNVLVSKIKDIGKKQVKTRHLFFIGKFLK